MYRAQIIAAAEVEFSRSGYASTKVGAIAQTADLSLATVYKHFAGKSEIWDELHTVRMQELLARVEAERVRTGSVVDRILSSIASVARYLTEHPSYLDLNLWTGSGWASTADSHGVQQSVWGAGLESITDGVQHAVDEGEIRDLKPSVAAGLIVSTLQVFLADWAASGRVENPESVIAGMVQRMRWMLVGR